MTFETAGRIKNICYLAATVLAVLSFVIPSLWPVLLILAAIVMVGCFVVSFRFYRCPFCDKPLPTNAKMPKKCPNCGEVLK